MTRHGLLHLHAIAVIRCQKVRADQQQDDLGALQMGINRPGPFGPSGDAAIMPVGNNALTFQEAQMVVEFIAQPFIGVGIGVKHLDAA